MDDYRTLPAWKEGMSFAHAVYAALEVAGIKEGEQGKRLRKAAVAIPSLIAETCLELMGREPEEALFLAESKLAEVIRLLDDPELASLSEPERDALIKDAERLLKEIGEMRTERISARSPS
ncbi:MAG TPA: four helix bundle protein [Thermoanaerobaculia bacterium]|nr:four helix bundle protein [Thermoanaerobaculia bacterium]